MNGKLKYLFRILKKIVITIKVIMQLNARREEIWQPSLY